MSIKLDTFMGTYRDFSRPYLFYCKILGAATAYLPTDHAYLVNATSLPAQSLDEITASWQGMAYKIAGVSTYADFTVTFKNDSDGVIRRAFLAWSNDIHNPKTNIHGRPGDSGGYFGTIILEHLDTTGKVMQTYNLIGAWPKTVAALTLDYTAKDLQTFDITFSYQYHVIGDISEGTIQNTGMGATV